MFSTPVASRALTLRVIPFVAAALLAHPSLRAQSPPQDWSAERPAVEIVSAKPTFPMLSPKASSPDDAGEAVLEKSATSAAVGSTVTVASSLAVVLGLFAGLVWLTRRFGSASGAGRAIPRDACEVLGSTTIDPRLKVTLLRVGGRVVVLAQTANGVHPISEIADADEAQRLIATCRGEASQTFAQELQAIEKEPFRPGFVDSSSETPAAQRRRLFATA